MYYIYYILYKHYISNNIILQSQSCMNWSNSLAVTVCSVSISLWPRRWAAAVLLWTASAFCFRLRNAYTILPLHKLPGAGYFQHPSTNCQP